MADRLDRYRSKRDFGATPEPGGDAAADEEALKPFVVHEHHARRLHWDLRLERDGVLVSWAVPKGIPPDPARNNLAVPTDDPAPARAPPPAPAGRAPRLASMCCGGAPPGGGGGGGGKGVRGPGSAGTPT